LEGGKIGKFALDGLEFVFAILPVIGAAVAAVASLLAGATETLGRIRTVLVNSPLTTSIVVAYGTVVLAVLTVALFLLVRSAERPAVSPPALTQHTGSSAAPAVQDRGPPLSPTEVVARERERNFSEAQSAFTRTRRRLSDETDRFSATAC
jgi:hypothetical protein